MVDILINQRIIPWRQRLHLPIFLAIPQTGAVYFPRPLLFHVQSIYERTALYCRRILEPAADAHFHREMQFHHISVTPFPVDDCYLSGSKSPGSGRFRSDRCGICRNPVCPVWPHHDFRSVSPGRDTKMQRKCHRTVCTDFQSDTITVRIVCHLPYRHRNTGHLGPHRTRRISDGGKSSVGTPEPQVLGEFRPALMQVAQAARIAGKKAHQVCRAVLHDGEIVVSERNTHLIRLLIVLMKPEIIRNLGFKGIERDAFQIFGIKRISGDFQHFFERIHEFHRRTQFRAACRIVVPETFVTAVHSCRIADKARHVREKLVCRPEQTVITRGRPVDYRFLQSLRQIHAMDGAGTRNPLVLKILHEIETLFMQQIGKLQQIFLTGTPVQPEHNIHLVRLSERSPECPVVQRLFFQHFELIAEISVEEDRHSFVPGGVVVLVQDFQHHHSRPPVQGIVPLQPGFGRIVRPRTEIPVFRLAGQCPFHPRLHLRLQVIVVQNVSQREQPVYPVRSSLPLVPVTSEPSVPRAHHLRICLVQIAGNIISLKFKVFP